MFLFNAIIAKRVLIFVVLGTNLNIPQPACAWLWRSAPSQAVSPTVEEDTATARQRLRSPSSQYRRSTGDWDTANFHYANNKYFDTPSSLRKPRGRRSSRDVAVAHAPFPEESLQRLAVWESRATVSACWRSAVAAFQSKCGSPTTTATDTDRSVMALVLMNCQLETDGKQPHVCTGLPSGAAAVMLGASPPPPELVQQCVGHMRDDTVYPLYIQFRIHLDTLCFYVGEEVARERMERATSDLHVAADVASAAVDRLEARAAAVEDRMESAGNAMLERFDTQLGEAQSQVASLAAVANGIAEQHDAALQATRDHQAAMTLLISDSSDQLKGQQEMLGTILTSATDLARFTHAQHERMSASSNDIIATLDRVYGMQRAIADSFTMAQMAGVYLMMGSSTVLATLPMRAHAARPWSLLAVGVGAYCEYVYVHMDPVGSVRFLFALATTPLMGCVVPSGTAAVLLASGLGEPQHLAEEETVHGVRGTDAAAYAVETLAKLWRRFIMFLIGGFVLFSVLMFESSEARLHRLITNALRGLTATTIGMEMPHERSEMNGNACGNVCERTIQSGTCCGDATCGSLPSSKRARKR